MPLNLPPLPPALQEKLAPALEQAKVWAAEAGVHAGPVVAEALAQIKAFMQRMEQSAPGATLGGSFRHVAVVGLNRVELLMSGETDPVAGDSWQDLVDETLRRHTALVFFAPRGLDGQPVNPYLFLTGEWVLSDTDEETDANTLSVAQSAPSGLALLDFCRISPASPNTVNILLAADTLFHWDVKDNYVLPTTTTGWVRDLEQIIKSYPRTTRFHVFSQWDTEVFPPSERIIFHKLRELPLDDATWLNQPTFQEKYGAHVLTFSLALAVLVYAGLWMKGHTLTDIQDRLHEVEQQIPRGGQFSDLEKAIGEQEKHFAKRELFPVIAKDAARAAQRAGFQIVNFEVKVDDIQNPPKQYVVTWEAKKNVYQGWLQEEPVARELLLNAATLQAIRKPPIANVFKLEGLVNAEALSKAYTQQVKRFVHTPVAASPTEPKETPTGAPVLPKQSFVGASVSHMEPRQAPAPAEAPAVPAAPGPAAEPAAGPVAAGTAPDGQEVAQ